MSRSCSVCGEAAAVRDGTLCRACQRDAEYADRRSRPGYYHARRKARLIDLGDMRQAVATWRSWPGASRCAVTMHPLVGRQCVAHWPPNILAGVIVAVERCAGRPGWEMPVSACWVWLLDGGPAGWELHVPVLKFARDRVELVTRRDELVEETVS